MTKPLYKLVFVPIVDCFIPPLDPSGKVFSDLLCFAQHNKSEIIFIAVLQAEQMHQKLGATKSYCNI